MFTYDYDMKANNKLKTFRYPFYLLCEIDYCHSHTQMVMVTEWMALLQRAIVIQIIQAIINSSNTQWTISLWRKWVEIFQIYDNQTCNIIDGLGP